MTKQSHGLFRPVFPTDGGFHVESSTELHVFNNVCCVLLSSGKQRSCSQHEGLKGRTQTTRSIWLLPCGGVAHIEAMVNY